MPINPTNHALIIRIQAEYSAAAQIMSIRYILEIPSSGEHRGFAEVGDLISALQIELTKIASPIVASEQNEEKPRSYK